MSEIYGESRTASEPEGESVAVVPGGVSRIGLRFPGPIE